MGMISASDFIETLRKLRAAAGSGGGALSDAEMDAHTIRAMRAAAAADGAPPRPLVFCRETDNFSTVRLYCSPHVYELFGHTLEVESAVRVAVTCVAKWPGLSHGAFPLQ